MAWEPGYAFWGKPPEWDHLHVVVSPVAANGRVVVVNVTTKRAHSDPTCVIHPGEHSAIVQPSVVSYFHARCVRLKDLVDLLGNGALQPREPLSKELLARVVQGFADSDDVIEEIRVEMELHGMIGPDGS